MGIVVANIVVPPVSYSTNKVIPFIHPVTKSKHVLGLGYLVLTGKCMPLHPFGRFNTRQAYQCWCQVNKVNQAITLSTRLVFRRCQVFPLFWEVNHNRN